MPDARTRRTALLVDTETAWIRRPADAAGAIAAGLGIVAVLLLSVYAASTTLGVIRDARTAADGLFATILAMPINVLVGLLTFIAPLAVLIELIWTRSRRALITSITAMIAAGVLSNLIGWAFQKYLPEAPVTTTIVGAVEGQKLIILVPYLAIISALCSAAGTRQSMRTLAWTWPLLWAVLILSILQGTQTLPGSLATILFGMVVGLTCRYLFGTIPDRASGLGLVRLVRRAGIDATEIVRVGRQIDPDDLIAWRATTSSPVGYLDRFGLARLQEFIDRTFTPIDIVDADSAAESLIPESLVDPVEIVENYDTYEVPYSETVSRNYIAIDSGGQAHHIVVLDQDRHLIDQLTKLWSKFRLRIQYRDADVSIHETADKVMLMGLAAQHYGIDVPDLEGVASSDDTVVIATKLLRAPTLDRVHDDELTDDVLDQLWIILSRAHTAGLAHRNIHAGVVLLDEGELVLTTWHDGGIAASEVSRRIDQAQALAMVASLVGARRAIASFERGNGPDQLVSIAPVLQRSILPKQTTANLEKKELTELREALGRRVPAAKDVQPMEMRRFSPKTVVSMTILVVALYVLAGTINFSEVWAALKQANFVMLGFAIIGSILTYVGAGLHLKAYTPENIPLGQTTIVQLAASIVTLVVPAGIGPAALNLRYLSKKGVATALGVATVSLVQITQLITTVLLLIIVALVTGQAGVLSLPSGSVVVAVLIAVAAVAAALLIPPLRSWVFAKVGPTFQQVWPRVVWLSTHPSRIFLGLAGSLIQTIGYIAAFGFSLAAFGHTLPVVTLAITFLVSNTVGSVVPSPGGIGPVEAALTGGLAVAGIPYSVALSTSLIYRLVTFWGPVPPGWFSLRWLQKRDIV